MGQGGRSPRRSTKDRRLFPVGLIASLLVASCVTPYDPFKIPAEDLRARVDTIALAPFAVGSDIGDRERLRPRVEELATQRLKAGGWRIVPMDTVESIWEQTGNEVGPLYDHRGKVDSDRREIVEDLVLRKLIAVHNVDAVLYLKILPVDLNVVRGETLFCGVWGKPYWPGGPMGIGKVATLARAGCLYANLYDMEGREIYNIRHGLEIYETYAKQTRALRPLEERFTKDEQLRAAVEATLGPLADRPKRR